MTSLGDSRNWPLFRVYKYLFKWQHASLFETQRIFNHNPHLAHSSLVSLGWPQVFRFIFYCMGSYHELILHCKGTFRKTKILVSLEILNASNQVNPWFGEVVSSYCINKYVPLLIIQIIESVNWSNLRNICSWCLPSLCLISFHNVLL